MTMLEAALNHGDTDNPASRDAAVLDEVAFERLISREHARIWQLAHRLLGWPVDRNEVDDVVQEAFLRTWMYRNQFQENSSPETWLTRIAINAVRSYQRKKRLRRFLPWEHAARQETNHPQLDADSTIEQLESIEQVRTIITLLPQSLREVMVLHYIEDRSADEIAELLGIRKNAVEVRLYRGRQKLKTAMNGRMNDD